MAATGWWPLLFVNGLTRPTTDHLSSCEKRGEKFIELEESLRRITMALPKTTKEKLFTAFSILTIAFFVSQRVLQGKKRTTLVRPLLVLSRYETRKLCQFWEMPVYPDQTNEELFFARNRIRKQLLPMLRSFFNPQVDVVFSHLSEALLLERLHIEFISIKFGRNNRHWNLLQSIYPILRVRQIQPIVPQYCVSLYPPHAQSGSRLGIAANTNATPVFSYFSAYPNAALHQEQVFQNNRFEPFEASCFPLAINREAVNRLVQSLVKRWVHGRTQEKRPLPVSLQQIRRKLIPIKMVSWSSATHLNSYPTLDRCRDHPLSRRTPPNGCCQGNTCKDSVSYKNILSCESAPRTFRNCPCRHQYFYFPGVGGFLKSGITLPCKDTKQAADLARPAP